MNNPRTMSLTDLERLRDEARRQAEIQRTETDDPHEWTWTGREIGLSHLLDQRMRSEVVLPARAAKVPVRDYYLTVKDVTRG